MEYRRNHEVNFPEMTEKDLDSHHGGGFFVNDEIFVLVHEVAVHGLVCDRLSTHAF